MSPFSLICPTGSTPLLSNVMPALNPIFHAITLEVGGQVCQRAAAAAAFVFFCFALAFFLSSVARFMLFLFPQDFQLELPTIDFALQLEKRFHVFVHPFKTEAYM